MDEAERCTRIAYLAYGDLLTTGTVKEVIAETGLLTWQIHGDVTTSVLQQVKTIPGVLQAALFGSALHVCGYDAALIEQGLRHLSHITSLHWQSINTTLEDAFISLVNASQRDKSGAFL